MLPQIKKTLNYKRLPNILLWGRDLIKPVQFFIKARFRLYYLTQGEAQRLHERQPSYIFCTPKIRLEPTYSRSKLHEFQDLVP